MACLPCACEDDVADPDADSGGELLGCTGLGEWNEPAIVREGLLMDPGGSRKVLLENVLLTLVQCVFALVEPSLYFSHECVIWYLEDLHRCPSDVVCLPCAPRNREVKARSASRMCQSVFLARPSSVSRVPLPSRAAG